jgi:probable rRNA maturation factor
MTVTFEHEYDLDLGIDLEQICKEVISYVIDYVECPYECDVNVTFTDNETIAAVNQEYRNIARATDVLSFPSVEYPAPADFTHLEEDVMAFHPETGELLLGDIMLSLDKVAEQAREYGHSNKRELAFLTAHSMLHLFGYDHMEDEERLIMEQKQREVMDGLNITR